MSVLAKTFTALVCIVVWACSSDMEGPRKDVDTGDVAVDQGVPDHHVDMTMDQSLDASSDDSHDLDDTPDMRDQEATQPECICADPLATCHPRTGSCIREGADCTVEGCPDGYRCITPLDTNLEPEGPPICLCEGTTDECGPFCDENQNCPGTRFQCDTNPQGGVCRVRIECQDDYQCGPDKVCAWVERLDEEVCIARGEKLDGESCSNRTECASRRCIDGVCTPICKVNSDCDGGEVCRFGANSYPNDQNGCIPGVCELDDCDPTRNRCFAIGPESNGVTPYTCAPPVCEVSGDCENADCVVQLGIRRAGECQVLAQGEIPACKPGEFRAFEGDPFCRLPDPCWTSDYCDGEECHDCPAQYDCLVPDVDFSPWSYLSFCSRLVE